MSVSYLQKLLDNKIGKSGFKIPKEISKSSDHWELEEFYEGTEVLQIKSIEVAISLSEIYEGVKWGVSG